MGLKLPRYVKSPIPKLEEKKRIDKFDYIMSTLNNIQRRLTSIEQSATNINSGISIDILSKIEEKGNEVAEANQVSTNNIAKAIKNIKDVVLQKLIDENRKLRKKVVTNDNKIIEIEKQVHRNDQHSRKVNFEIDGFPESLKQDALKPALVSVLNKAGLPNATIKDIEVIHRLNSKKTHKLVS